MKPLRALDVIHAVGAAGRAVSAALDSRQARIEPHMLNSAGSVAAEWYVEALWHYLSKRRFLQGVSAIDVEFEQPATPADKHVLFSLPQPEADDLVMGFHVLRLPARGKRKVPVPVARIRIHRASRRRLAADAPDAPHHPYGLEIRERHLNHAKQVSWHTMVAMTMDVARRGAQFADAVGGERPDATRLYVVPRFSFTPLADAAAQPNLFVYPEFALDQPWAAGRTSMSARVTIWAVAYDDPWPLASSVVTVVRTTLASGVRRPVDEHGDTAQKSARRSRSGDQLLTVGPRS
jgi:hypothetical protein